MTAAHVFGFVVTGFMFGAVAASSQTVARRVRFARERRSELSRLAGIDTRPTVRPINSIRRGPMRRDPSPQPRHVQRFGSVFPR